MQKTRITFLATPQIKSSIDKLSVERGWTVTETIKRGIELLEEKLSKQKYGYAGSAMAEQKISSVLKKSKHEESLAIIRTGSDQEITSLVKSLEFGPPDDTKIKDGVIKKYYFKNGWWTSLWTYQNDDGTEKFGCPPFEDQLLDREALIRELIKDKKI